MGHSLVVVVGDEKEDRLGRRIRGELVGDKAGSLTEVGDLVEELELGF